MSLKQVEQAINELGDKPILKGFIECSDVFAQSPSGIVKLKELILKLAIEGKLNTSSNNDKDAKDILDKIRSTYSEWSHLKKSPQYDAVQDNDAHFSKPKKWSFVRLGEIISISSGDGLTKSKMEDGNVPVYGGNGITGFHSCGNVSEETLVIGRVGYYCGSVHLTENTAWITDNAFITRYPKKYIYLPFLVWLLKATDLQKNESSTAQPVISGRKVYPIIVGLPPIEEQKRIVAKVDELMALCDQLETQQQQQANTLLKANTAAIQALLSSENSKDDQKNNWQRLADNFHTLYGNTLPMPPGEGRQKKYLVGLENVKQLRNVILQLAVTGKLVAQDSKERPAFDLIQSIEQTKQNLIKEKVINRQSIFPAIPEKDEPFALPEGWSFVRLGQITNRIGSGSTPRGGKNAYVESGIPFLRSQNVWNDDLKLDDVAYIPDETHEKMTNTKVFPRDILLNITGASLGRCALLPDDFDEANVSQHVTIIRPTEPETRQYLHLCMLSPHTQNMVWGRQVGMAREGLSKKVLEQFEIPLPPLEEQKRIVAKVTALMSLCEKLEQQLTLSYDQAEKLITATTKALVA